MPVSTVYNTNNLDVIVKTLRRRKVSFLVQSPFINSQENSKSKLRSSLKIVSKKASEGPKSPNRRNLSVKSVYSKRRLDFPSDHKTDHPHSIYEVPRKSYRRKVAPTVLDNTTDIPSSHDDSTSNSTLSQLSDLTVSSCQTVIVKVAKVLDNTTDIPDSHDESTSNSTLSQLSDWTVSSNQTNTCHPEGLECPSITSSVFAESSCKSSVTPKATPKRNRRNFFRIEYRSLLDEEENEPLSEYELQRQKNIEENLKMLREILGEESPSQDQNQVARKERKSYGRVPLPPPRPKSARIEQKRSSYLNPINFSKLNEMLQLD